MHLSSDSIYTYWGNLIEICLQAKSAMPSIQFEAPFTLHWIAIVTPQLSYRIGVLFTSHQSYPIHDAPQIGAKITSLHR